MVTPKHPANPRIGTSGKTVPVSFGCHLSLSRCRRYRSYILQNLTGIFKRSRRSAVLIILTLCQGPEIAS